MSTLKTLWTLWKYSSLIVPLIVKIRELVGSDAMQAVVNAITEFIDKVSPPAPTADSTGVKPANLEREKKNRLLRLRRRLGIAGAITENEAREFCAQHHIDTYPIA